MSNPADVTGFDGIWVVPGSPYEHRDGVLAAIQAAHVNGIPFLGTCGGFQHLLLEFARNVCGLSGADNAEERPDASPLLIVPLECSLLGEEAAVVVQADTLAAALMGEGPAVERFFCRYGLDERYLDALIGSGLVVSGRDVTGAVRLIELPDHPFFLGSLFQPELSSDETWVHPLIGGFIAAVRAHREPDRPPGRSPRMGPLMPIVPDIKDWTWVLDRPCDECGFDVRAVPLRSIPGLFASNAAAWGSILARGESASLAERPSDDCWSTLEYACHVRDVYRLANVRVGLMLADENPTFENWDQDATAVEEHYQQQDPADVAAEISDAADELARLYSSLPSRAAMRPGTRSDGARFTVESFGRYVLHDPVHHLADVRKP